MEPDRLRDKIRILNNIDVDTTSIKKSYLVTRFKGYKNKEIKEFLDTLGFGMRSHNEL